MDIQAVLSAILGSATLSGILFGGLAKAAHDAISHLPSAKTNKDLNFYLQVLYVVLSALLPVLHQMLSGDQSALPTAADLQQSLQMVVGMFSAHYAMSDKKLLDVSKK